MGQSESVLIAEIPGLCCRAPGRGTLVAAAPIAVAATLATSPGVTKLAALTRLKIGAVSILSLNAHH